MSQIYTLPSIFFKNDTNERSGAMLLIKKLNDNFVELFYLIIIMMNKHYANIDIGMKINSSCA